jgi:hypothetical protein
LAPRVFTGSIRKSNRGGLCITRQSTPTPKDVRSLRSRLFLGAGYFYVRAHVQDRSLSEVASEWIDAWSGGKTGEVGPGGGGSALDWGLPREQPELAWLAILEVLSIIGADIKDRRFAVLAAGPLEDLLSEHGKLMIDRVETEARRNPDFALLLGGVWRNDIEAEVWERMGKFAKRGW